MSNNFDGPILIDSAGDYIGFDRPAGQSASVGPRLYQATNLAAIDTILTAPTGSLCMLRDGNVARCIGGSSWALLPTSSGAPTGGVVLATAAGSLQPFASIALAMAAANAGDNILLYPGTYSETVDFTGKPGVYLTGIGSDRAAIIAGPDATSSRVIPAAGCGVGGVTILGPSAGALPLIDLSGLAAGERFTLSRSVLQGQGGTGPGVGPTAGDVEIFGLEHDGGAMGPVVDQGTGSGTVQFANLLLRSGTTTQAIRSGGTARVIGNGVLVGQGYTAAGLFQISGTGFFDISTVTIDGQAAVDNGLLISADGVDINFRNAELEGNVTDIVVQGGLTGVGTEILLNSCEFRQERVVAPGAFFQNANLEVIYFDTGAQNDRALRVGAELSVGAPFLGRESAFGEGDSSVNGMSVLSDDGTGTSFVDNTAAARSSSGSPFALFQAPAAGQVAYIGALTDALGGARQFPGIEVDGGGTAIDLGAGGIQAEYWNGAAWVDLTVMVTDAGAPYAQKAKNAFATTTTSDQIRWKPPSDWAQTTVDGRQGFWVRWRITGAITTTPVLERIKLGTNRTKVNSDGVIEFFGSAIRQATLQQVSLATISDLSGASPSNGTIQYSPSISLTPIDNRFNDGALDGFGIALSVPDGIDTSRPLQCRVLFRCANNSAGDVQFELLTTRVQEGDTVNGALPEVNGTGITTIGAGTQDQAYLKTLEADISDFTADDFIVLALRRDARGSNPADTYAGNIEIMFIEALGSFWRP